MPVTLYGTTELIQVQQHFPDLPDGFWRDLFTRGVTSDKQDIAFDRIDLPNRRLAPFVAPNVQGRVMRAQGYETRTFKPAYTKPKHIIDPSKAIPRMMGEPLLGSMSLAARFDAHVALSMRQEREDIERLWDWMACKALVDGKVTVVGEDYPSVTVDFLRHASLTNTLLTTARWDQLTTADPLGDLAHMVDLSFPLGNGPITDIVFGTNAWRYFMKNAAVLELLSTLRRGSTSDFSRTVLNNNANYQSMGFIDGGSGRFNLYRYSNYYSEDQTDGTLITRQFLDPNDVVGYGPIFDGVAMFGAILDADANFGLAEAMIYPKMWREPDPSVVYTMSQSAPLYALTNPNNTFKLTVIT